MSLELGQALTLGVWLLALILLVVLQAGPPLLRWWRSWWPKHAQLSTHALTPPPQHANCRCMLWQDSDGGQEAREASAILSAHMGQGTVTPVRIPLEGGGHTTLYRHTFPGGPHVQPYRPEERPLRLARERCRYCSHVVLTERMQDHLRAHLN